MLVTLLLDTPTLLLLRHARSHFTTILPFSGTDRLQHLTLGKHDLLLLMLHDAPPLKSPSGSPPGRGSSVTILIGLLLGQPVSAAGRGRGFSGLKRIISAWHPALNTEIQPPSRDHLRPDTLVSGRLCPLAAPPAAFPLRKT